MDTDSHRTHKQPHKQQGTRETRRVRGPLHRILTKAASCVLAIGVCAAGLAACGTSSASEVTLDFFQYKFEASDWFTKAARDFEQMHPGIRVNVNNSPNAVTDLRTRLVKNRTPDVITINGDINYGMLAEAGVFHDFTDDPVVGTLNPGMVKITKNLVQTDDPSHKRLYGLPFAGNASGYIINAQLWRKAGLDPDNPPTTYDGFINALKTFKQKGITPVAASYGDPWTLQAPLASLSSTLVPESEYARLKAGKTTFSELWTPTAQKLVEIYQNYVQANPGITYQQATQDFANGKAAVLPLGTYAIPQVRLINKNIDIRFAQMPATNNPKEQKLTAGDDVMLTMGANTKHPKEAREFIDFLMSRERLEDYARAQSAFTPLKETYVGDKALQGVVPFFEESRLTDFCDHYVPPSINIAGFMTTLVQTGNVDQFTKSMQAEYDKAQARNFR